MAQEERIMDKKKDALEQRLAEDFKKLAEEEEQNIAKHKSEEDIQMPKGSKEAIRARLDEEIKKLREAEKAELYSRLSEEDRRALELGRKAMQEEKERRTKRHGRPRRLYIAVAALVAALCGISMNAFGVQERMIIMMQSLVGDREIEQVDSSDENLVIVEEDEEEAYQRISDEFGVEPVKIMSGSQKKQFDRMEYDSQMQVAELLYKIDGEIITYLVNASFKDSSWGVDVEDEITNQYINKVNGCEIQIKEYQIEDENKTRYSAQFSYMGLEYFLIGTMSPKEFNEIINNLYFL